MIDFRPPLKFGAVILTVALATSCATKVYYVYWPVRGKYYTAEELEATDFSGTAVAPTAGYDAEILERVNDYRKAAGLEPVRLCAELEAAAQSHADYLRANGFENGHNEKRGAPGFTGEDAASRAAHFGYKWDGVHEVISQSPSAARVVDGFVGTLYHRLPLLDPDARELGVGSAERAGAGQWKTTCTVLDVGVFRKFWREDPFKKKPPDRPAALYPFPRQTDVPREFIRETPSPLPRGEESAGFPITLLVPASFVKIKVARASLADDRGRPVPFYLLTPSNDPNKFLSNAVALVPKEPLAPATTYRVSVSYKLNDGPQVDAAWSFTTRAE